MCAQVLRLKPCGAFLPFLDSKPVVRPTSSGIPLNRRGDWIIPSFIYFCNYTPAFVSFHPVSCWVFWTICIHRPRILIAWLCLVPCSIEGIASVARLTWRRSYPPPMVLNWCFHSLRRASPCVEHQYDIWPCLPHPPNALYRYPRSSRLAISL